MTGLVIRILTCDETDDGEVCDAEYGGDADMPSLDALRSEAAENGWRHLEGYGDFCPDHS
ncbi:hypothetical protein [Streptomyces sp. NPDC005244]|uniref:hypothetical protein n=1 Tax=Streptomyces sp. NPDC005244 TaxID=3364708 RepID=UPI0036A98187